MPEHQTTQDLQNCLDRLRAGDADARARLVNAATERLRRLTKKMIKDYPGVRRWEETGDVCQNAAVRLWKALEAVRPESVLQFMRLAALNIRRELIDLARHHYGAEGAGAYHATPRGPAGGTPAPLDPAVAASNAPDRLAGWAEFHEKVGALPENERTAFDLLWYQGLSQAQAAEVLGVSERTVKRHWQSARLMLHAALGGAMPE
jgi:RNA polymerase sigma-70 factor (ECF subfamily)